MLSEKLRATFVSWQRERGGGRKERDRQRDREGERERKGEGEREEGESLVIVFLVHSKTPHAGNSSTKVSP